MEISILIVTKGRPDEVGITLNKVRRCIDLSVHEVRVFIDGCKKTESIIKNFPWVKWKISEKSVGASPARHLLYKEAKGAILIGLDDDAHIVTSNAITLIENKFNLNPNLGIIAFKEVKGVFESDNLIGVLEKKAEYLTTEFIGCGFAVKRKVYLETRGFPLWIDIYGEESCVSMEVLDLGYDILYTNAIVVNHRIDRAKRRLQGRNYYRFERQLRNSCRIFLVYYPNPIMRILKLLLHNFKKYALSDAVYFKLYWKAVGNMIFTFFYILKFRRPIQKVTQNRIRKLKNVPY
ncbi:Glycosyltransferase, GT2 family [Flavobacterium gillisiae]|uniref:Glycosyltransferase, GT2 family n=1 Tax=Flavobacterium gillisiae TaxID=150146 RepID=A0A1H4EWX0_9FLAO|nr:family 2 glycosyl transferase [Flavobacterium gillisiae]SEA89078.1 Glycosyltransferase, GT2 family [Flavobacterium gillisiae]